LLMPNPPTLPPYVAGDHSREATIWRQYLHDHKQTLEKIEPTGEELVSSKQVCLQILKADPAIPSQHNRPKSAR
jgi:hypothetical protein